MATAEAPRRSTSTPRVRPTTWETHLRQIRLRGASGERLRGAPPRVITRASRDPARAAAAHPVSWTSSAEPSARSRAPRPRAGQLPPPRRPAELLPGEPRPAGARTARAVASGRPAPVPRRAAAPQGAAQGPRSPLRGLDRAGPRLHRRRRLRRRAEHRARGGRARRAGRVRRPCDVSCRNFRTRDETRGCRCLEPDTGECSRASSPHGPPGSPARVTCVCLSVCL